jgi:pimeloyl-ACP methyl ester carboxylesterase
VETVRSNGLDLAYKRVGEGPPLVFVHGAAEDGRVWQPQLAALANEFTVVAWDEPGAGRSSDVPADFNLADYANCLAALIEALALGRRTSPASPGAALSYRSCTATIPGWSRP